MIHAGLSQGWAAVVALSVLGIFSWALLARAPLEITRHTTLLINLPVVGPWLHGLSTNRLPLQVLKVLVVALFLLVIAAGLMGTPIAARNAATVLTWNLWWTGLIVAVFFAGSAWCAVCPWDTLSEWLVRRGNRLNLRVPKLLRSILPALILLIGLTWLELGVGLTLNPYATALLALAMVAMAVTSLAIFERKAFCRYFCPIGRTVGAYSQLAPVELRPIEIQVCNDCTTLDCYHGNEEVAPCPTHLVMGRLTQNSYCISCGNCVASCPTQNVSWRLRAPSREAIQDARPHWDEAWFMLMLLAITEFHGITMLPQWQEWMSVLARVLPNDGQMLMSFTIGMATVLALAIAVYFVAAWLTVLSGGRSGELKSVINGLAFVTLPLAFAYHLAHNVGHLARETSGLGAVLTDPFGRVALPLSQAEQHARYMDMLLPENVLFALQSALLLFGFWIAIAVIRHRGPRVVPVERWRPLPMLLYAVGITGIHLWLLTQPMMGRM
jgi:polyferredoxin